MVKVFTEIRHSDKSSILKSIIVESEDRGLKEQVIYLPLDQRGFKDITTSKDLVERIEAQIQDDGRYSLFIDEVQNVKGFEKSGPPIGRIGTCICKRTGPFPAPS